MTVHSIAIVVVIGDIIQFQDWRVAAAFEIMLLVKLYAPFIVKHISIVITFTR